MAVLGHRGALALLLIPAGQLVAGCPSANRCVRDDDSVRTLFVDAPTDPGPDNATVRGTFTRLQDALDAAGGSLGRATICVAGGTYEEELVVPADVHLLALSPVRVRPPQTRRSAHPTAVGRTLLTAHTGTAGPIVIDGFDLRSGGVCVAARGDGELVLRDTIVVGCAVGVTVRESATVRLQRTPLLDHAVRGVDLQGGSLLAEAGSDLLRNGRPLLGLGLANRLEPDPGLTWAADLLPGHGALIARGGAVSLSDLEVNENEYDGGLLDVTDGTLTLDRVVLAGQRPAANSEGFLAGDSGGDGPLLRLASSVADLDRVLARSEGQGLLDVSGADSDVLLTNVSFVGTDAPSAGSAPVVPVRAEGSGAVTLQHVSLLGGASAGISISEGGGDGPLTLSVENSVVWGHDDGVVIESGGDTPALRFSLFEDGTTGGTQMSTAADPGWTDTASGLALDADSPARCRGAGDVPAPLDLLGERRPFSEGKAPDLGAIELQAACPP